MSPTLRQRLRERAVAGRYEVFLGLGGGLAILGAILFARAMGNEYTAPRAWHLFHVNWLYFTGLTFGSIAFAAVQKVAHGRWSGLMIRFAEAAVAFVPLSLIGLVLIFTVGYESIYGPMEEAAHGMPHAKALWLSHGFMFGRLFVGMLALGFLGWRFIRADVAPDMYATRGAVNGGRRRMFERWTRHLEGPGANEANEDRLHKLATGYLPLYAIVMTMIAFDGIMALQPHWFSNLLGGFYFMGSFLGAHMLLALTMMYGASHLGIGDLISPKQRHDLGKLCFGFTVFWTYLMWAQFLVIWYGNLPEETGFVFSRLWGQWRPIGVMVFLGMFIIPFFGLLGVSPKKTRPVLGFFAVVSLTALWLERYLLVMPSVSALPGPRLYVPELGPTFMMLGLFLLAYAMFARTFPMLSPRLAEVTLNHERHHVIEAAEFEHEESAKDYVAPEAMERREHPR